MEQRAEVPPTPPNPLKRPSKGHSVEGSIKDTIESILVAFILAFIFRAFIVEAFVIPTGSMAPTLLGAHMRFRCPDCGYRFQVNFSAPDSQSNEIYIPDTAAGRTYLASCPNCGYRLPADNAEDPENAAANPVVHYGDRILVLKYLYLFEQPHRWDVVVFKSPHDHVNQDYSQNYIKRLVGLPGESVMILDGDVYVSSDRGPEPPLESFKIQTKPQHVQDALWRIVYDNDYYPRGLPRSDRDSDDQSIAVFRQPWTMEHPHDTGWALGDGTPGHRDFNFSSAAGRSALLFNPRLNPHAYSLTDWLAYDVSETSPWAPTQVPSNVNDVKLSFVYQRQQGAGPFTAQIKTFQPQISDQSLRVREQTRQVEHEFEARIVDGKVSLLMDGKAIGEAVNLPRASGPVQVELIHVDYRTSIRIDGQEVLATTETQYHPDMDRLMDAFRKRMVTPSVEVRLIGENQACSVSHVSLWRDIYYINRNERGPDRRPQWASPIDLPENLARLDDDQFFVLGDNSAVSLDARFWYEPIELEREDLHVKAGVVPRRFMLGKAFFVYWPAGYSLLGFRPSLVPNFGDMRFIH
jgi:signal peptidase I